MKIILLLPVLLLLADVAPTAAVPHQRFAEIEGLGAAGQNLAESWIQLFVYRGEKVTAGQKLAVQTNARGKVIQEYIAGVAGKVTIIRRNAPESADAILEIGTVTAVDACGDSDCELTDID